MRSERWEVRSEKRFGGPNRRQSSHPTSHISLLKGDGVLFVERTGELHLAGEVKRQSRESRSESES